MLLRNDTLKAGKRIEYDGADIRVINETEDNQVLKREYKNGTTQTQARGPRRHHVDALERISKAASQQDSKRASEQVGVPVCKRVSLSAEQRNGRLADKPTSRFAGKPIGRQAGLAIDVAEHPERQYEQHYRRQASATEPPGEQSCKTSSRRSFHRSSLWRLSDPIQSRLHGGTSDDVA